MSFKEFISKNGPYILTGAGITGMILSTVLAVKATPNAMRSIAEKKQALGIDQNEKLSFKETIKSAGKYYIAPAVIGATGAGLIIGSDVMQGKRLAMTGAAYMAATGALATCQQKMLDVAGKNVTEKVNQAIVEDKVQAIEKKEAETEAKTGKTKEIVYIKKDGAMFLDTTTGRRFMADIDEVRNAIKEVEIEHRESCEPFVPLNEIYERIGLDSCEYGNQYGFDLNVTKHIGIDLIPILENNNQVITLRYDAMLDTSSSW